MKIKHAKIFPERNGILSDYVAIIRYKKKQYSTGTFLNKQIDRILKYDLVGFIVYDEIGKKNKFLKFNSEGGFDTTDLNGFGKVKKFDSCFAFMIGDDKIIFGTIKDIDRNGYNLNAYNISTDSVESLGEYYPYAFNDEYMFLIDSTWKTGTSYNNNARTIATDAILYKIKSETNAIESVSVSSFNIKPEDFYNEKIDFPDGSSLETMKSAHLFYTSIPIWLNRKLDLAFIGTRKVNGDGDLLYFPTPFWKTFDFGQYSPRPIEVTPGNWTSGLLSSFKSGDSSNTGNCVIDDCKTCYCLTTGIGAMKRQISSLNNEYYQTKYLHGFSSSSYLYNGINYLPQDLILLNSDEKIFLGLNGVFIDVFNNRSIYYYKNVQTLKVLEEVDKKRVYIRPDDYYNGKRTGSYDFYAYSQSLEGGFGFYSTSCSLTSGAVVNQENNITFLASTGQIFYCGNEEKAQFPGTGANEEITFDMGKITLDDGHQFTGMSASFENSGALSFFYKISESGTWKSLQPNKYYDIGEELREKNTRDIFFKAITGSTGSKQKNISNGLSLSFS